MLQFKDVAQTESTLSTIGTVAEFIGVNGRYEPLSKKNFQGVLNEKTGKLNRVTIALFNAKGQKAIINCSEPLSKDLRSSTPEELKVKIDNLASFPILELPQIERNEASPNFGKPIMVMNEETGVEEQLVLYTISFTGATDMSATSVTITDEMLNKEIASRAINFEDLIAI